MRRFNIPGLTTCRFICFSLWPNCLYGLWEKRLYSVSLWPWGDMDWIDLAQDMHRWRALVSTVENLRVP